jgi:CTP synthase (UTP-ammonia lyase)
VHFEEGSLIGSAYGASSATEGYRCNYGFNAAYRAPMERAGLRFTAWDDSGEVRGAELQGRAFYAGVLFQPERAALRGEVPPLVLAFTSAAARAS